MGLGKIVPVLKRDYWGVKTNTLLLLVILLFPMVFGFIFGTFKNVVPKNAPAAVFPGEGANEEDIRAAEGIVSYFSKTSVMENFDENLLFREEYYFFVAVPKGFRYGPKSVDVYIDASMSPVSELSPYVKEMILYGLSARGWHTDINVIAIGESVLPFQYFVPGVVVLLSAVLGLVILPFYSSQDSRVMRRVLSNVSTLVFVAGKLLFAVILSFVQLGVLLATQVLAGASKSALLGISQWTVFVVFLCAVFFASVGMAVLFLTRFGEGGKQINAGILGLVVVFSGAFYPVGFFPTVPGFGDVLQTIGRSNPSYFFVLLMRGFGIRELGVGVLADYFALVLLLTAFSVAAFAYAVNVVKRNG